MHYINNIIYFLQSQSIISVNCFCSCNIYIRFRTAALILFICTTVFLHSIKVTGNDELLMI